ncbi:alkene reductase [Pseudomaricurvus alkylphenolicus]|uniref:alkene reductase n=1 Tax=Pseudomaricurvus alkylphenolicus TaxID=1306991 RepID=UPI0014202B98|nr:alkene reductase [Pseudomaricurvus alkylphenolicus]NIB38017.1 alkene reductase [Pseudomaricurvus alkylphenolicus]
MSRLLESCNFGRLRLNNRIVMAPMTRSRALDDGTPSEMMLEYYRQRASAGLIIAEGTYPSENGKGYCRTPGIVNQDQIDAWKRITDAVHDQGGTIVLQVMHVGRCSHADNKSKTAETVAPSAIAADGAVYTEAGMKPFSMPRELDVAEIKNIVHEYAQATANAYEAGFDGVELHGASGYLPAQFLSPGSNHRTDAYGGSLENRVRFFLEALEAMAAVDGAERVGLRICPGFPFNDVKDPDPEESTRGLLQGISHLPLAYLHLMRASTIDVIGLSKQYFKGPLILNGGYTQARAEKAIDKQEGDAIAFGNAFIANPDLVDRFRNDYPLAPTDESRLYTNTREGYCDYPAYVA